MPTFEDLTKLTADPSLDDLEKGLSSGEIKPEELTDRAQLLLGLRKGEIKPEEISPRGLGAVFGKPYADIEKPKPVSQTIVENLGRLQPQPDETLAKSPFAKYQGPPQQAKPTDILIQPQADPLYEAQQTVKAIAHGALTSPEAFTQQLPYAEGLGERGKPLIPPVLGEITKGIYETTPVKKALEPITPEPGMAGQVGEIIGQLGMGAVLSMIPTLARAMRMKPSQVMQQVVAESKATNTPINEVVKNYLDQYQIAGIPSTEAQFTVPPKFEGTVTQPRVEPTIRELPPTIPEPIRAKIKQARMKPPKSGEEVPISAFQSPEVKPTEITPTEPKSFKVTPEEVKGEITPYREGMEEVKPPQLSDLTYGDNLASKGIPGTMRVYRGVPDYAEDTLRPNDFVITDPDMAWAYSGNRGKLIAADIPTDKLQFHQANNNRYELRYIGNEPIGEPATVKLPEAPPVEAKPTEPIKFETGGDALGDQYNGYIVAKNKNGEPMGYVDYSYWHGKTKVMMIEVKPEFRRKGVGLALLNKLQSEAEPGDVIGIQGDIATPEGQALWKRFKGKKAKTPTPTEPMPPTQPQISAGVKEAPTEVAEYHDLQGRPITKAGELTEHPTTITGEPIKPVRETPIKPVTEKPLQPTLSPTDVEAQMENRITDIDTQINELQKKLELSYGAEMEGASRADVRDVLHRQAKSAATREINKLGKRYGTPADIEGQITTLQNERADILKQVGIEPPPVAEAPTVPEVKQPWEMTRKEWIRKAAHDETEAKRIEQNKIIGSTTIKAKHEVAVRDAIDAGLPVPPEVLKDYPELQKPSLAKRLITEEKGGFNFFTGPQLPKPKDPLAARVHDVFEQADTELAAKRATTPGKIKAWMRRQFVDVSGNVKAELENQGILGKDAVLKHDLALGSSDKAQLEWNNAYKSIYDGLSPEEGKLLDRIIQARRNIDISKYRPDVKHPGGLTGVDYQAYIDSLPLEISKRLQPKADAYFSVMKDQLTQLYDKGLLSDKSYNALIIHDYEPRRFIQHIDPPSSSYSWTGNKITVPDSGIKALDEGSERMLENDSGLMLSNVINRTQARIAKNDANKALYELATKQPGNGIVEVGGEKAAPGGFEKISVMIDGEQHQMIMPSAMAKEWVKGDPALNRTQAEIVQWITGGKPLKMMATGYNPIFAVSNIFRDAALAQFATKEYSPFLPKAIVEQLHDYGKVFGDVMLKKGRYIDYVNEGGGMDFLTYQGNLGYLDKVPAVGKPLNALGQLLRFTGERSELLTRIALRERAIANGATPQEATYIARNYIDFSQGGQTAKFLDNFLPYFNAGIQGTRGVARAAWRNPAIVAFKFAQVGGFASGLYYVNTRINKEAWDSIPDRDKEANWIITTPYSYNDSNGNKRWVYFKIPVEQSIRLAKTMFEAGSARVLDGKMPTKQVLQSIKDSISIFPNNFLPPVASAIATYMTNYDFWRNDKIWKGPEVLPWQEFTPRTHPAWQKLGEVSAYVESKLTDKPIEKVKGISPERFAVATSQVFTYSNPIATMVGAGMKELMDPLPEAVKAKTTTEILTSNPSVRRFMSATPPVSESLKQRTQELGVEENTRRYKQSREIDSMLMRMDAGDLKRQDVIGYIRTQPPLDRQRLLKRMQHSLQVKDIPDKSWWLDAAELLPEARAKIFAERFNQADPEERKRLTKTARRIPGFLGGRMGGLLRKELILHPQVQAGGE